MHQVKRSSGWRLPTRIRGVLRHPRATFNALADTPRSVDVLAFACVAAFAATALVLETETGELALLDHLERGVSAFDARLDETQHAALQQISGHGAAYALVRSLAGGPLLAGAVSAALYGWSQIQGQTPTPTYRQLLAVASHASVILALRQVIAAPLTYVRETMASPLTLNMFFTLLDEGSPLARFAAMIDLFVIWWIVVLAIGMSIHCRRPVQHLAMAFIGAYVLLAALVALMAATIGGAA
jgi:hypothetical protein